MLKAPQRPSVFWKSDVLYFNIEKVLKCLLNPQLRILTYYFTYKYSLACRPQCFFKCRHCYFILLSSAEGPCLSFSSCDAWDFWEEHWRPYPLTPCTSSNTTPDSHEENGGVQTRGPLISPRQLLKKGVMVLVIIRLERGWRGVSGGTELIHDVVSHTFKASPR